MGLYLAGSVGHPAEVLAILQLPALWRLLSSLQVRAREGLVLPGSIQEQYFATMVFGPSQAPRSSTNRQGHEIMTSIFKGFGSICTRTKASARRGLIHGQHELQGPVGQNPGLPTNC